MRHKDTTEVTEEEEFDKRQVVAGRLKNATPERAISTRYRERRKNEGGERQILRMCLMNQCVKVQSAGQDLKKQYKL